MGFKVVHSNQWDVVGDANSFGHIGSNEQGSHESGALSYSHGVDIIDGDLGFF